VLLNYIQELLVALAQAPVVGKVVLRDDAGNARVLVCTRTWPDYVSLATSEIGQCGVTSTQVCRRLRAMLFDLLPLVDDDHRAALETELALLDGHTRNAFTEPDILAFALGTDRQGIGGTG